MPRPRSRSPRPRHRDRRSRSRSRSRSPYYKKNIRRSRSPYKSSNRKSPQRSYSSSHRAGGSASSRDHRPANKQYPVKDSRSRHHSSSSANKSGSSRRENPVKNQQPLDNRRNSRSPVRREPHPDFVDSSQKGWDPYSSAGPQGKQSPPHGAPYGQQRSYSPASRDMDLLFPAARSSGIQDLTMVYPSEPRMLIGRRFHALETEVFQPPVLEENITIGIHRKGPNMRHDPDLPIKRGYNPRVELTIHRKDEGKKPLFDREEIKKFRHDDFLDDEMYEEKRTISVKHTSKSSRSHKEDDKRIVQQPDSRKIVGGNRTSRSGGTSPKIKFDPRPDPRYEEMFRTEEKFRTQEKPFSEKVQRNPNDLRYSLLKRRHNDDDTDDRSHFDARKKIEEKRKQMDGGRGERRRARSRERNPQDRIRDRNRSSDSRKEELPDFSNRPGRQESMDKFVTDEWKDKPEMIPKNPMYYEHDNRDGENMSSRSTRSFRPRGIAPPGSNYKGVNYNPNFRSRGRFRGSSFRSPRGSFTRGRGSFNIRSRSGFDSDRRSTGTWKHDKYEDDDVSKDSKHDRSSSTKADEKEDNKPTSTTSH